MLVTLACFSYFFLVRDQESYSVNVCLMPSAQLSYAKLSSVDRILQPGQKQQDDWFKYLDRTFTERADTRPCELTHK